MTNLLRVLCSEPLNFRPWEVGRLTPFQVRRVLLAERDKKGAVVLDAPLDDGSQPVELSIEAEWRSHYRRAGVSDPSAMRMLVARAMREEAEGTSIPPDSPDAPDEAIEA